jgi:KTSC domain
MDRIEVDSTTLAWAAYSPDRRLLELAFHSGNVYDYFDVPLRTYNELLHADSKGRYLNLSPILRQTVKSQNSMNGDFSWVWLDGNSHGN